MRKFRFLFAVCALAAMMLSIGCEKETPVGPSTDDLTAIVLEHTSLEVDAKGGEMTVGYSIESPISGAKALLISNVEWIVAGESEADKLLFTVDKNISTEDRSTTLIVRYPQAEEVTLEVKQFGVTSAEFELSVTEITYNGFESELKAADQSTYYVLYMSEVSYFEEWEIDTNDELFMDDKLFFEEYAAYFGMNLGDFMEEYGFAYQGDRISDWTSLVPACEYAVYAYGIEFNDDRSDYTRTTPVYYALAETPINEIGTQNIAVELSINGPEVEIGMTPENYAGNYVSYIFSDLEPLYMPEGGKVDEAYTLAIAQQWMRDYNSYSLYSEMSNAEIIAAYTHSGEVVVGETLSANSRYSIAVFTIAEVDGLLMLSSTPIVKSFATGSVEQSDMTFEVTLNSCYSRVADITITPSNDDEYYTILLVQSDELGGMTDGDEIVEWVVTSYWFSEYIGEYNYYANYLEPETDYSLLVFGVYANAATTGLTRLDFTTEPAAAAQNRVARIEFNGPYDPMAIYALDQSDTTLPYYEGYFVMWMETIAEHDNYADVYHYIYDTATIAAWGDEAIFEDLAAYYYEPIGTAPGEFGVEYRLAATLQDEKGNYCEMVYSDPFTYTEADLRDPQEFIDKVYYSDTRSRGRMVVVGRNEIESLLKAKQSFEVVAPSVVAPVAPKPATKKYDKLAR